MKDKYGRAVTVRVYGKTLNEWTVTAEWHEREYEKLVQKEVEYREYDSESGDLVGAGSEDFSPERWNREVEDRWIWTWDGQKRNKGGYRWFECCGWSNFRKTEKKAYKEYLKNKYNAELVELR